MILNMTGGGGGIATIFVSYPYSSTLTCTNGTITLTATNPTTSRANAFFNVPSTGTWTITAKNNSFTASNTVVAAVGGSYFVELYYRSYFIQDGIIKVTPVFNDPNNIFNNLDASGNDIYESYYKPRHTWFFCTRGSWGNHHAEVMFPVTITYAKRLVFVNGADYNPPGGGGTPSGGLANMVYHSDRGFMPNYTTDINPGTNKQMVTIYDGGVYTEGLSQLGSLYIYTDLEGFSGSGYAAMGWESFSGGLLGLEVKHFYLEY